MNKYQSDDYRREELIRIIEHSVEKLTQSSKRWLRTPSVMKSRLSSGMTLTICKKQRLSDSMIHLTSIKDN